MDHPGQSSGRPAAIRRAAQADLGDFAGALDTMRALASNPMYIDCLADIAKGQAKAGDVAGALDTAAKVRALNARDRARNETHPQTVAYNDLILAETLAEVALAQAKAGEAGVADARETIRDALDLVDRSLAVRADVGAPALARIALAQAKTRGSRGLAEELRACDPGQRRPHGAFPAAEILAKIAEARWKAGDTAEARAILHEAFERSGPLDNQYSQVNDIITQAQLAVGDLDGALQTARASINERGELILDDDMVRQLVRAARDGDRSTPGAGGVAEVRAVALAPRLAPARRGRGRRCTRDPEAVGSSLGESACRSQPSYLVALAQLPASPDPKPVPINGIVV